MSSTPLHDSRVRLAALLLAGVASIAAVQAQTPPPAQQPAPADKPTEADKESGRRNQKIEHIHTEDSGATVDELRVGGETQNITVKPKSNVPAYQVQPNDDQRNRNQGQPAANASDEGSRVWWNVFKF
jgi:hypothetical protein